MQKVLLSFFALFIFSCSASYEIELKKNGSAQVHYLYKTSIPDSLSSMITEDMYDKSLDTIETVFKEHYKHKQISRYKYQLTKQRDIYVKFKIKDINQLGNFMVPGNSNEWFQFNHTKGKLIITCPTRLNEQPSLETGYNQLFSFNMKLTLPSEIKKIDAQTEMKIRYSGKELFIQSDISQMSFSQTDTKITIEY